MQAGQVVGDRFEIEAEAGSGGMGVVYRARDRTNGAVVALKVMHAVGEEAARRLEREATALAAIAHPGIVRYIAHGPSWIAMEWLEGEDLKERLARRGLTVAEGVALAQAVAGALGAAHARGVVHRDVKPANVWLVGKDPSQVKLLDFGIVRAQVHAAMTRTGAVIGTPAYMAPEQARGDRSLDARADVFSLGCVIFECVTGRPPFVGESLAAVLAKVLFEEVPPLGEVATVPRPLEQLVGKMLSKDPGPRPRDGQEVARALMAFDLTLYAGATASTSLRPPALTGREQRLSSVVLIAPTRTGAANQPADTRTEATAVDIVEGGLLAAIRHVAVDHGARAEPLADGSIVVTLEGLAAPTDQAARAAACALALTRAAAGVGAATFALATGRTLGGAARVGEALDRAARLLRAPRPTKGLRVDEITAGLLDARFELEGDAAGLILAGERQRRAEVRTLLGKPTPCVGRERDLAMLEGTLAQTIEDETASAVVVTAPPGAGKTRLGYELLQRVRARTDPAVQVWIGRGDPIGAGSSFALAIQMISTTAGIQTGEPLEARRDKLRARVGRNVEASKIARVCDFLGEMIGTPFPDNAPLVGARADAVALGDQVRLAWVDFVEAELGAGPLLIVLDDLHWGDAATAQMVNLVLDVCRNKPLMALALGRPEIDEQLPDLWAKRVTQRVALGALSRKAAEKLARNVLGDAADAQLIERICAQAQGNAFSLEELLRAHAEGRSDVPETVLGIIEARMESLSVESRRALRAASVFGQTFWAGAVTTLLGGAAHTTLTGLLLAELERGEWITLRSESRFRGESEYAFRHPLVRETAYAMLTDEDRRLGHALAGGWLEKIGAADATALAEHFERGGDKARAVRWWHRAAAESLEGGALIEALARAERGVACGATGETLGELRVLEARVCFWRGEPEPAQRHAREALELLTVESPSFWDALAELASALFSLGDLAGLVDVATRVLDTTPHASAEASRGVVAAGLARTLTLAGRPQHVPALVALAEGVAERHPDDGPLLARLHRARGMLAKFRGDLGACLSSVKAARAAWERAGDLKQGANMDAIVGDAWMHVGRYGEAESVLRAALSTAERLGLTSVSGLAWMNLSFVLAREGRLVEAEQACSAALDAAERGKEQYSARFCHIYLAGIHRRQGEMAKAEQHARAGMLGRDPLSAVAETALAEVFLARGEPAEALECTRRALDILGEKGMIEGEAELRLVHAEALHAAGEHDAAKLAIREARDRVLERARAIGEPELRESFLEKIEEHARTVTLARSWLGE